MPVMKKRPLWKTTRQAFGCKGVTAGDAAPQQGGGQKSKTEGAEDRVVSFLHTESSPETGVGV